MINFFEGTMEEYLSLDIKDNNALYFVTDGEDGLIYKGSQSFSSHGGGANQNSQIKKAILDAHPVGTYYWSSKSTNPSEFIGGEWEAVEDVFLYAAGKKEAGTTGGVEVTALEIKPLPAHSHTFTGTAVANHKHSFSAAIGNH